MKKLAIFGRKGGIGKSTVTVNLAHALTKIGMKVLLIDLDSQNDSSLFLGIDKEQYNKFVFDDLFNKRNPVKLRDTMIEARESLWLIPNDSLENVESELHRTSRIDNILNHLLSDLDDMDFDIILFDTQPTRSKISDSILLYCEGLILPVQLQSASVRSIGNIYEYLSDLYINPDIIKAVVPNMYNKITCDSKENLAFVKSFFEQDIVTPAIPTRTRISESGKHGKTVFEYDQESTVQFMAVIEKLVTLI